jgi:hypothetical protein
VDDLKKKMGSSVFKMDDVKHVLTISDINQAKQFATEILNNSTANHGNKERIAKVIQSSKTVASLAMAMSSHILAHPSEGLKVI